MNKIVKQTCEEIK